VAIKKNLVDFINLGGVNYVDRQMSTWLTEVHLHWNKFSSLFYCSVKSDMRCAR